MLLQIREISVVIIFILLSSISSNSQNIDKTLELAAIERQKGNIDLSLKLFNRVLFFSDNVKKEYIYSNVADIYYLNNKYNDAIINYDSLINITSSLSKKDSIRLIKAKIYLLSSDYYSAIKSIENIDNRHYSQKLKYVYLGTAYFGIDSFKMSKNCFIKAISKTDTFKISKINKIFENISLQKFPKIKIAKTLSRFIPGSGQLYLKDYKNAVKSFLLVSSIALVSINIYQQFGWLDSFISVMPWFFRYYKSGYLKAEQYAIKKKEAIKNDYFNDILQILLF